MSANPFGYQPELDPIKFFEQYNMLYPTLPFEPEQLTQFDPFPLNRITTPPPSLIDTHAQLGQDIQMEGVFFDPATQEGEAAVLTPYALAELERLATEWTPLDGTQLGSWSLPQPPTTQSYQSYQPNHSPISTEPSIFDASPDLHSWDSPGTSSTAPTPSTVASSASVQLRNPARSNSNGSQFSTRSAGIAVGAASLVKRKSALQVAEKKNAEGTVRKAEEPKRCR